MGKPVSPKHESELLPTAQMLADRPRQRLLGDRTFVLISHVLRAADRLIELHADEHEPGCWCGHCSQTLAFDSWAELAGMRWPLRQVLAVFDGCTSATFAAGDATGVGTIGAALRALADLSDAVDRAHWKDFGPLESLTGPNPPPVDDDDEDEPDADAPTTVAGR